jgi:hypothetical protein
VKQMRIFSCSLIFVILTATILFCQPLDNDKRLQSYVNVLSKQGKDPIDFVIDNFEDHDLIIFDDALHTAVEPFKFYQELIKSPSFSSNVNYIFLEALSINKQQHIDAYFESEPENIELLYPAFQDDINGTGWSYKTYFDLLHTIYTLNETLSKDKRFKVIGVSNPTYWSEIKTSRDFELFQKTLRTHDFFMYKTILLEMSNLESGKKGIFLTNTRHAYKGIKNKNNEFYWNTGTFFYQWHPDKTYSIRFHNVQLFIEKQVTISFLWDRIGEGIWDNAFEVFGNKPVGISLKDNVFGNESYVGNHMLNVAPNQTVYDAYDALIFLGPLEKMNKTAIVDFIYTKEFKKELERRYHILYSEEQIKKQFEDYGVNDINELIEIAFVSESQILLPQAKLVGPIDAWREVKNK